MPRGRKCRAFFWLASHSFSLLLSSTKHKSIASADHGHSRSLCSIVLKEVELIILNWTRSIESKVDTAIIFFRKMRGIYAHAAFAPTTGIVDHEFMTKIQIREHHKEWCATSIKFWGNFREKLSNFEISNSDTSSNARQYDYVR